VVLSIEKGKKKKKKKKKNKPGRRMKRAGGRTLGWFS
jgi:hypothetical protein